jgi:phospholipase C
MARLTRRRLGALAAGSAVAGALGTACRADPAPAGDAFKQFRYIVVVLMFENRSFDNILAGCTSATARRSAGAMTASPART